MLTAHLEGQLRTFLAAQPIFSLVADRSLAELVQQLELVSFTMGQEVFSEGDAADCAYLVYSGKARVFKHGPEGKPILLGTVFPGDLVGEQALTRRQGRSASVRAADDLVLLRIDRAAFEKLLRDHSELAPYLERLERQRAASNFLRLATFFGALPAKQVIGLLDVLQECGFQKGETVVRQGDAGDRMYIVKSGEARVVRAEAGQETVLAYLRQGDYFGERALILNEPRFASVIALDNLECFSLSREGFEGLLRSAPQLQEHLRVRLEQYERVTQAASRPPLEIAQVQSRNPPPGLVWEPAPDLPPPSKRRRLREQRSWLHFFRTFPFVAQEDETDCGAAALAMIGRYHGLRLSLARLRELVHVGIGGASMMGLAKAAEAAGFSWRAVATDFAHLADLSLPAVAHWKGHHYLVLYKVRDDCVFVADPAVGRLQMSRQNFEADWTGKLLLLTPNAERKAAGARQHVSTARGATDDSPPLSLRGALHAPVLIWTVLACVLLAISVVLLPLGAQLLVDRVLPGQDENSVALVCAGLLAGTLAVGLAAFMRQRLLDRVWPAFLRKLRADWFARLLKTPLWTSQGRPIGTFLTRLEEAHEADNLAARMGVTVFFDMPVLAASLVLLFTLHAVLALLAILALTAPLVLALYSWRGWRHAQQGSWLARTTTASLLVEALEALPAIKDANAELLLADQFRSAALAQPLPIQRLAGAVCWPSVLLLASAFVFGYGADLVLSGQLTAGQLVAFQVALVLATVPLVSIAGLGSEVVRLRMLLRRLREVWEVSSEDDFPSSVSAAREAPGADSGSVAAARDLPPLRGLIQLDQVGFRYHPESPNALTAVNLTIPAGQTVAIIGRAGAGKTTLALLLQQFYRPTEGTIRIDGIDLSRVPVSALRGQVSLVGQKPALLTGTVRANIALADPDAAIERVIEAAKLANAHDFISAWPQAYDTILGAGGTRPSFGEAQALCLARAFLKEPRVLILDDVLSALDLDSEAVVLKSLRSARGRTTILLSRRPLPPGHADSIVVLDAGQIVEAGSHRTLLEQKGLYYFWTGRGS